MNNKYVMTCKAGKYEARSMCGLAWEILKHRIYHLFRHGRWID